METSMTEIRVKKRNGRGDEDLRLEKIHKMVEYACEGLAGVSESQIETLIKLGHKRVEQFRANQLRAPNLRARF